MRFPFFFLVFILVTVVTFSNHVFAGTDTFTRTLVEGMKGKDVRILQRFLNTNFETMVAKTGDGSPGNETDYFGSATTRALIKFQEKYREEVLIPSGLTYGTGFFGKMSRAKINELKLKGSGTFLFREKEKSLTLLTPPVEKGEVIVKYPSQYTGKAGTTISLYGDGFTPTRNTVYFDTTPAIKDITSQNTGTLQFKVPALQKGIYPLFVKNARGESKRGAFFVITDGVSKSPTIESITPLHAVRGDIVTIKGTGFSTTGNMVQASTVGVFENISSNDGETISFGIPKNIFGSEVSLPTTEVNSWPMRIYVINENGMSNSKNFMLDM